MRWTIPAVIDVRMPTLKKNDGYCYRLQLDNKAEGHSVLTFLTQHYTHSSEAEWAARIQAGEVHLDDSVASTHQSLAPGMRLIWNRPGWIEEETPQTYRIEFEDAHLLVVSKPSGLPTLPGGGFYRNTLLAFVKADYPRARPMHRLGRGTSGLVLFALTEETASAIARQWNQVEKQYQALGSGRALQDEYDVRQSIGPVEHPRLGRVYAASLRGESGGKAARSVVRSLERREQATLFEVDLYSGRPHQIRIHLACIGHPLVGEPMYASGGHLQDLPGLPGDLGYHLHAKRLRLEHPITKQQLEFRSELPELLRPEEGQRTP